MNANYMHTFFHGWRRKVGCVALLMTSLLMALWVRSHVVMDSISFPVNRRQQDVLAYNGQVIWAAYNREPGQYLVSGWACAPLTEQYIDTLDNAFYAFDPKFTVDEPNLKFQKCGISYWSVTIPLVLLSAYLILWKPPKKPQV